MRESNTLDLKGCFKKIDFKDKAPKSTYRDVQYCLLKNSCSKWVAMRSFALSLKRAKSVKLTTFNIFINGSILQNLYFSALVISCRLETKINLKNSMALKLNTNKGLFKIQEINL
jgi:hypothetical protein